MPFCAERKHTNTNNKRCFTRSSLADRSRLYNIERTRTRTLQFIKNNNNNANQKFTFESERKRDDNEMSTETEQTESDINKMFLGASPRNEFQENEQVDS